MLLYQFSINAYVKDFGVAYVWLHEFENNPQLFSKLGVGYKIASVDYTPGTRCLRLTLNGIGELGGSIKVLVFVNCIFSKDVKTNVKSEIQKKLEEIEI